LHHDRASFFARQRLAETIFTVSPRSISLNPFLCRLGVDGGLRGACFAIGDSSLGGTDEPSSPSIVSVCTRRSPSQKRRSTLAFYVAQFVGRWHRDSLIYGDEDLALLVYDPIREGRETIMQAPPERDAVDRRGRNGDRSQPRDMFMARLATFAASLNQAHLQPVGSFAEADEHRVVVSFSLIIRLCEKPRHYKGAVVTSPAPTHPNLRMGRLFVQVSALRDRELLHTLAPVGFENGDHLSLWDFARRPVEEVRNCSARAGQRPLLRAVVPFMEKTCRSAKVDLTRSPHRLGNGRYLRNATKESESTSSAHANCGCISRLENSSRIAERKQPMTQSYDLHREEMHRHSRQGCRGPT
jgi:hypothetical protein